MAEPGPAVSIVVPMLDAEQRVTRLYDRVQHVIDGALSPCELILVDDASADRTWPLVRQLAREDPRVVGVRLARNVGQTGALCAGFGQARGPVVVMVDDDLESDPAEMVPFVEAVRSGAEFASGWRRGPRPRDRALGSRLYNARLRSWGLPFHDAGCGLNAMTGQLAHQLAAEGWAVRQHRFKPSVARLTDSIVEVPFPVRLTSESHHTARKLAASWLDVELVVGRLTVRRYFLSAVAAPAVVGAAAAWMAARGTRLHLSRRLGVPVALGGLTIAIFAMEVLRLRTGWERQTLEQPPFEVAETTSR